ncbi:MAG TPA: DUF2461 domain-containing protein [Bryobacteraceae bacterium]|nr:DUF2461 domain-containing protein [Bryobacteraceae bacterium]
MSSGFPGFPPEMVQFLRALKRNNRREWFQPRKHLYEQQVKEPMLELVTALNGDFMKFAPHFVTEPKKAVFRIYRDTRFSADNTPYKTHVAASFWRRGSDYTGAGGFYLSVSHDQIEVAGGIWHPSPETMLLVRTHIAASYPEMRRILANKKSRKLVGDLQGAELTRAPKGFDPQHPALDLIKKKDWILDVSLDAALATTPKLYREILDRFRAIAPLIEYLNRPLIGRKPARESMEAHF